MGSSPNVADRHSRQHGVSIAEAILCGFKPRWTTPTRTCLVVSIAEAILCGFKPTKVSIMTGLEPVSIAEAILCGFKQVGGVGRLRRLGVSIAEAILCGFKRRPGNGSKAEYRFQSLRRFSVGSSGRGRGIQRANRRGFQSLRRFSVCSSTAHVRPACVPFWFQSLRRFSVGSSFMAPTKSPSAVKFQSLRRFSVGSSTQFQTVVNTLGWVSIAEAILCGFKLPRADHVPDGVLGFNR